MRTAELRQERAEKAAVLREAGLNGLQIANELGVSKSYAYDLLSDPDGSKTKERKRQYDGICVDCGGRTVGDGGIPPNRCAPCAHLASRKWGHEEIISAIQEWVRRFGDPPTANNWNVASPYHDAEKWASGDWPSQATVQIYFGTWSGGIRAAGFTPRLARNGGPGHGPGSLTSEDLQRTIALVEEHGLKEAAHRLGLTVPGVQVRLRKTNRKELVMAGRLSPVQVMEREMERLQHDVEEAEARVDEKKDAIAQYQEAIKVLARTNGSAKS